MELNTSTFAVHEEDHDKIKRNSGLKHMDVGFFFGSQRFFKNFEELERIQCWAKENLHSDQPSSRLAGVIGFNHRTKRPV